MQASDIAQVVGAVGGLSGISSGLFIILLLKRTKDLETAHADCQKTSREQAVAIGELRGEVRALSGPLSRAVERIAESMAPPTHERVEYDARTAELVERHRKDSEDRIPMGKLPPPPPLPKMPKGTIK